MPELPEWVVCEGAQPKRVATRSSKHVSAYRPAALIVVARLYRQGWQRRWKTIALGHCPARTVPALCRGRSHRCGWSSTPS